MAAIGQSTAMVAHDVRKPLAGMKALLAALPAVKDDPDQLAKMAAGVDRNIATTNALLNDILEFSRDSTALDLRDHDPQSIITAALGEVLRNRSDADVRIEYDLRHRSYLRVDDGRIVRVLTNIIANAVEAMEGRGRLWFRTEERGRADLGQGRMLLAVGNSGPVIPEDARSRLFDPFFTQGKKGGTGLGLAICRRIIDLHGGSIEVASERDESTGEPSTEFTLELLAAEGRLFVNEAELIHHSSEFATFHKEDALREEVGDTASTAEFLRLNKERGRPSYLLIVDDEPLFRETVRGLLETVSQVKDHVKVIEADSAETGLKIFEGREFDYVIADIDLGRTRMNGYEFAQIILDQYPGTHVLIHSNKRREEMDRNIRQINSSRFMGFLPKPMKQSELLQFLACKTFEARGTDGSAAQPRRKVLVVNDDEGLSLSFRIMLKSPGVQVLEAGSVSDALKWISGGGVDVILSDINLGEGEKDGYELLRTVREKDATIPFYLVSGYSRADEEPKAKERGANGYLQLPVDKEQLEVLMQ